MTTREAIVVGAAPGRRRFEALTLVLVGAVAAVLLGRQIRHVDLEIMLSQVRAGWAAIAIVLVGASFLGAAWNLMGFSVVPLRARPTVLVQVAGGFVKVVSPAAVGAALVNLRYLRQVGASRAGAAASIVAAQLVQFLVTVAFLGTLAVLPDSPVSRLRFGPAAVGIGVGVVGAVAGVAWFGRRHRRIQPVLDRCRAEAAALVRHARRHPGRVVLGVGGSIVLVLAFVLGLAASLRAFGGEPDLLTLTVVFLAGSAAGSLLPSPGGLGTVEAALVTGLVATGLPAEAVVPGVLWFRMISVWVPVPLGLLAIQALRRRGLL